MKHEQKGVLKYIGKKGAPLPTDRHRHSIKDFSITKESFNIIKRNKTDLYTLLCEYCLPSHII